jgi:hypothetical protein
MAARKSNKNLMPKPVGQPRLPRITKATAHITIMSAHMKRNDGPLETESTIVPPDKARNEMMLTVIYLPFS